MASGYDTRNQKRKKKTTTINTRKISDSNVKTHFFGEILTFFCIFSVKLFLIRHKKFNFAIRNAFQRKMSATNK
jgi:hypothetical protein